MLKYTVLSLTLLTTIAFASEIKSSTSVVEPSLEKAKAIRQQWEQYEKDYISNKEGARARFEEDFVKKGIPYKFKSDIGTILGFKFDNYPENTSLEAHPINKLNETELLITLIYSDNTKLPPQAKPLIFQKINSLDSEKPRVKALLGICYNYGVGCAKDDEEAISNMMLAALEGDIVGLSNSMTYACNGRDNYPKNLTLAFGLAQKLLKEHPHTLGHSLLGQLYYKGEKLIEKNLELAFKHCGIAAEGGVGTSQYVIGEMYFYGMGGVSRNMPLGIQWLELAASNGSNSAQAMLQKLQNIHSSLQPSLPEGAVSALMSLFSSPTPPTQTISQPASSPTALIPLQPLPHGNPNVSVRYPLVVNSSSSQPYHISQFNPIPKINPPMTGQLPYNLGRVFTPPTSLSTQPLPAPHFLSASAFPNTNKRIREDTQDERDSKRPRHDENQAEINAAILKELKELKAQLAVLTKQNPPSSQQDPRNNPDEDPDGAFNA